MNIGSAIKFCRTQRDLTQGELAERAEISVSYLSQLEKGRRDSTIKTIEKIAIALEIPSSILFFIASDHSELAPLDQSLAEKLSYAIFALLKEKKDAPSLL